MIWTGTGADRPVRLAVVGGNNRGRSFDDHLVQLAGRVQLAAVCDPQADVLTNWQARHPGIACYRRYDDLLADTAVDAVYVATPLLLHSEQAVLALQHGKHVLVEVPAATSIEGCRATIEAVRSSGLAYMMAENYIYSRETRLVAELVRRGLFGEITCADAAYVHDLRSLMHTPDGALTWRGELQRAWNCASYPTHALAGIHAWLEASAARTEFVSLTATSSKSAALPRYIRQTFGSAHPGADPNFWRHGDSVVTLLKTRDDVLVTLRVDMVSARPYDTMHNTLQGTTGAFITGRHFDESSLVWTDRDAGPSTPADWRPLKAHDATYQDPRWDGIDLAGQPEYPLWDRLMLEDFAEYVQHGTPPPFGVDAAVNLSAVIPLSEASAAGGGVPMTFPDFSGSTA